MNAQLKTVLDRLYAYLNQDLSTRIQPAKRSALVVTQGQADESLFMPYLSAVPKALELAGFGKPQVLVGAGLGAPDTLTQRPDLRERAREIGRRLAGA